MTTINRRQMLGATGGVLGLSLAACTTNNKTGTPTGFSGVSNVRDFGAVGDGKTDDTAAIQAAISDGEASGNVVFLPSGNYIISAQLTISSRIKIVGSGYQSSGSHFVIFNGAVTSITGVSGCTCIVQTTPTAHVFVATTTDAIQIESLEIYYPTFATALSGASAIVVDGGSGQANSQSLLRDIFITGADRGVGLNNCVSFVIDNVLFYNCQSYGILNDTTLTGVAASAGDWEIVNCTFESGSNFDYAHIALYAQGGGRIVCNKLNASGNGQHGSVGISISPGHVIAGGYNIEPMVIVGNSIEGSNYGVLFQGAPGHNGNSTLGLITGNQFWCNTCVKSVSDAQNLIWVYGWVLSGNVFNISPTASPYCLDIDAASDWNISGNLFASTGGGHGVRLGSNISNVVTANNVAQAGVTLSRTMSPVVPSSMITARNDLGSAMLVNITGGSGTRVAVNGQAVVDQAEAGFAVPHLVLSPGDEIHMVYTVAPSWTWRSFMP